MYYQQHIDYDWGLVMNRVISMAVLAMLATPASAQDFSWQSMLGQPLPAVVDRIAGAAECEMKPYSLQVFNSARGGKTTGQFWSPYEAASALVGDPHRIGVDFPSVQVATCIVEGEAGIKVLSTDAGVFRVEITYGECRNAYRVGQTTEFRCSREISGPAGYDGPILNSIGDNLKPRAVVDTSAENASLLADLDCSRDWSTYRSGDLLSQCRIFSSVTGGIWTGFGVVETLKPGFFGSSVEGQYVTLAQYVDVDAQAEVSASLAAAVETRVTEVRAYVEERRQTEQDAADQLERGKMEILTSVPN